MKKEWSQLAARDLSGGFKLTGDNKITRLFPSIRYSCPLSSREYAFPPSRRKCHRLPIALFQGNKGVSGGPSGPSREGPGVGYKIVSDTKLKERKKKKKMSRKREKCVKKKMEEREREKWTEINGKR